MRQQYLISFCLSAGAPLITCSHNHLQTSLSWILDKVRVILVLMSNSLVCKAGLFSCCSRTQLCTWHSWMPGSIYLPSDHGSPEAPGHDPSRSTLGSDWGCRGPEVCRPRAWGLESARPGFESLSLEGGLQGKMVGVGGWKRPEAVCIEDLRAMGGIDDRPCYYSRLSTGTCTLPAQVILSLNVFSVL